MGLFDGITGPFWGHENLQNRYELDRQAQLYAQPQIWQSYTPPARSRLHNLRSYRARIILHSNPSTRVRRQT